MATLSQIRKIHTLKALLGMDDETYLEMLKSFQVLSSKNLTYTEAQLLLSILEEDAVSAGVWNKQPKKYSELKRNVKMATPSQLRMIEGLWREVCYFDTDKFATQSLRKFLLNKFKVSDVMFLTKAKASKVIQAISGMKKNLEKSAAALS